MKKTASFIGLGKWSSDCPTVRMMARRVVLTLQLLATFALTTITIPLLLFNSKIVAQECRMLLPFAEAYKRPAPQVVPPVELHNSSPGQYTPSADVSVESSSWLSQLWGKTSSWCQNHPQLIGAVGVGGALIGGYLIYQYASSSAAGFPPLSTATPSPISSPSITCRGFISGFCLSNSAHRYK